MNILSPLMLFMSLPVAGQNWSLHICLTTQYYVKEGDDGRIPLAGESMRSSSCSSGWEPSPRQALTDYFHNFQLSSHGRGPCHGRGHLLGATEDNGRKLMQQTNKLMKLK